MKAKMFFLVCEAQKLSHVLENVSIDLDLSKQTQTIKFLIKCPILVLVLKCAKPLFL